LGGGLDMLDLGWKNPLKVCKANLQNECIKKMFICEEKLKKYFAEII